MPGMFMLAYPSMLSLMLDTVLHCIEVALKIPEFEFQGW